VQIVPAHWTRPARGDLAFAGLVGVLFALSPLTGRTRILPSLVLGAAAAAAVLAARMRRGPPPAAAPSGATLVRPALPVIGVLALTAIVFAPTLYWLFDVFTESVWRNGHGLFVPLFMVLLARSRLRRDPIRGEESSAWGFAWLVPALALAVADAGIGSLYLSALALVLALPGLSLLLLGAHRTRAIALPLALGVFLVPLPTLLEDAVGLRTATAALAKPMLLWLGAPVVFHQTQVRLPNGGFSISDNCSGFAALVASFAFATLLAVTARSRVRGVLLLLAVYPAVALLNGARAAALVLLVLRFGDGPIMYTTPVHGLSGIAVFIAVLGGLWLCADRAAFREAIS
jgi:exosortase